MNYQSRLLPLALFLLAATKALAGDPQLVFVNGDDENRIFRIADVGRVTFGEDGLLLSSTPESEIPYASINKMIFDYEGEYGQSSISRPAMLPAGEGISVTIIGHSMTISCPGEEKTDLRVFTTTGQLALSANGYTGDPLDISFLSPGVYIIKTNLSSAKFIKK